MADKFDLILSFTVSLLFVIDGIRMLKIRQNSLSGLRTSDTLSDPQIWEKANKISGIIFIFVGFLTIILSLSSLLLWHNWQVVFPLCVLGGAIGTGIFGSTYASKLKKEKQIKGKLKEYAIPKSFICIMIAVYTLFIVFGIVSFFILPNHYLGIRISKTLSNIEVWRKVNKVSGIGFIILGSLFAFLFAGDLRKEDAQRDKSFTRKLILSTILIVTWSLILVIYALAA